MLITFKYQFNKIKLDEHTVLTGSEDGNLRGVSIYPSKIISILGNHSEDDEHFPI